MMPKIASNDAQDIEQSQSLLSAPVDEQELEQTSTPPQAPLPSRRQSSLALANGAPRTPRTANRVHFNIEERASDDVRPNGHIAISGGENTGDWLDEDDYVSSSRGGDRRGHTEQRAPLLTDIEAPSVTIAGDLDFNAESLLESARPKSGMSSAFMNMANSIM